MLRSERVASTACPRRWPGSQVHSRPACFRWSSNPLRIRWMRQRGLLRLSARVRRRGGRQIAGRGRDRAGQDEPEPCSSSCPGFRPPGRPRFRDRSLRRSTQSTCGSTPSSRQSSAPGWGGGRSARWAISWDTPSPKSICARDSPSSPSRSTPSPSPAKPGATSRSARACRPPRSKSSARTAGNTVAGPRCAPSTSLTSGFPTGTRSSTANTNPGTVSTSPSTPLIATSKPDCSTTCRTNTSSST